MTTRTRPRRCCEHDLRPQAEIAAPGRQEGGDHPGCPGDPHPGRSPGCWRGPAALPGPARNRDGRLASDEGDGRRILRTGGHGVQAILAGPSSTPAAAASAPVSRSPPPGRCGSASAPGAAARAVPPPAPGSWMVARAWIRSACRPSTATSTRSPAAVAPAAHARPRWAAVRRSRPAATPSRARSSSSPARPCPAPCRAPTPCLRPVRPPRAVVHDRPAWREGSGQGRGRRPRRRR